MNNFFKGFLRTVIFIFTFLFILLATTYIALLMLFSKDNENVRRFATATFLETGALKTVPSFFIGEDEVNKILESTNKKIEMESTSQNEFYIQNLASNSNIDIVSIIDSASNLKIVNIASLSELKDLDENFYNEDGVHIDEVTRVGFRAKVMVIRDPSRVKLSSSYPFNARYDLEALVNKENAIAGINGGLYDYKAMFKTPIGVVVKGNNIEWLRMNHDINLTLVGFDDEHRLRIIEINKHPNDYVKKVILDNKIRDAVTFNEGRSYFTKLIVDGKDRYLDSNCIGINPRTAIGQREDGAVIFVVTDGRGKEGHIGANAQDLMNIMHQYDAINAANLDGGTSACMYYKDHYEMEGATMFLSVVSAPIPTAFVVAK